MMIWPDRQDNGLYWWPKAILPCVGGLALLRVCSRWKGLRPADKKESSSQTAGAGLLPWM